MSLDYRLKEVRPAYWSASGGDFCATRTYVEVGQFTKDHQYDYGQGYDKIVTPVYADVVTGLLVVDVEAFERWIR